MAALHAVPGGPNPGRRTGEPVAVPSPDPAVPAPVDLAARRTAVLFVLALAAVRVGALVAARTDLYVDEAQYWTWSQALDWGYFSKPPLIALVIRATTALFGDGEAAVRLAAPLFHAATALLVGRLGDRLYGGRVGALAAVLYALMPAVALSSTLISTDVPLLTFWTIGLLAAVRHGQTGGLGSALALGAAVAVGLNAKFAMGYLVPMVLLAYALDPALRRRLAGWRLWTGLALGVAGLVPNLIWQAAHDFVTFHHTGDNARWGRHGLDPLGALEFVGTQFGVFGPIPLALLGLATVGRLRTARPAADRFLLATSVPVLAALTAQALISEANANWAATAYPAATVLAAALLAAPARSAWRRATLAVGAVVSVALAIGPAVAPELRLPGIGRPYERLLGWTAYAEAIAAAARESGARTIVANRRADAAGLIYHLRDSGLAIAVPVEPGHPPRDHFQMTRPFSVALPAPGLEIGGGEPPPGTAPAGPETMLPVSRGVAKSGGVTLRPITW